MNSLWKARIALTSPTMPSRELRQWFRIVSLDSQVVVSHDYIERARDVFCKILKGLRKDQLAATIQVHAAEQRAAAPRGSQPVVRVYVKHLHDEVGMRLKSYSLDSVFGEHVFASRRGRASKVQNNCVQVFIGRTQLVWPTELQAMQRKDAATVATAIANVLCEIVDIAESAVDSSQCILSIHHLLSGDAVSTNGAASRRVLGFSVPALASRTGSWCGCAPPTKPIWLCR